MSNVYPIAVDGANYEVTVSAGVAFTPTTTAAKYITAGSTADGTFATTDLYTFPEDLDVDGDLSVGGTVTATGSITTSTNAIIGNDLIVANDADITGDVDITGDLTVSGSMGIVKTVSWPMGTSASAGHTYTGGYYLFGGSANDFNGAITFGTANGAYAAHFMVVCASGATDTVVTVTGTSILDDGTRTTSDSEELSLIDGSTDVFYETSKKWIGQVSVEKTAGTDRLCNYGFCKYWDHANKDFTVNAFEALWNASKTDAGFDVEILWHKATGWTYHAGAEPDPPVVQSMSGTHSTERSCIGGEPGAFKRTSSGVAIDGSGSEGILFAVTTTTTNVLNYGSIEIWFTD